MKVLIVGGGIAGPAVAALLQKKGVECVLIDQAPQWKHIGFGLTLWENGRKVLREIGVAHNLLGKEYLVPWEKVMDPQGKVLQEISFDFFGNNRPIIIHRADLHDGLIATLKDVETRLNTTITELHNYDDRVEVVFSDGKKETFDLVIGADGIHSKVREMIFPNDRARFYGWTLWVFWVKHSNAMTEGIPVTIAPGQAFSIFPIRNEWFSCLFTALPPNTPDPAETRIERFREHTSRLGTYVQTIIADVQNPAELYHSDLAYMNMGPWYKKRIVILGDARHGMSPVTGMGANLALEDASVLARELTSTTDIDKALKAFAQRRTPRVVKLRRIFRMLERMVFIESPLLSDIRNVCYPHVPMKRILKMINELLEEPF